VRYLTFLLALVGPALLWAQDPAAEKLMKDAHVVRSGWDKSFPGFTAQLVVNIDGQEATGKFTVTKEGKLDIELPAGPLADWAQQQLDSIVSHRNAGVRDKYDVSFADDVVNHPLGRLLKFSGSHNFYRIKGDLITEVHRETGKGGKFTISVTEAVKNSDGKYLPKAFSVTYWDGDGNITRNEDYHEDWVRVGNYDLPARRLLVRTSKGARSVAELKLNNPKLLGQ